METTISIEKKIRTHIRLCFLFLFFVLFCFVFVFVFVCLFVLFCFVLFCFVLFCFVLFCFCLKKTSLEFQSHLWGEAKFCKENTLTHLTTPAYKSPIRFFHLHSFAINSGNHSPLFGVVVRSSHPAPIIIWHTSLCICFVSFSHIRRYHNFR